MFGSIDPESKDSLENLPENVSYKGSFDGFDSLPTDEYDIYLYTSLFDGVPNTLLDAARLHLPIVASDVGGISEFVINQKTGFLIENISNPDSYSEVIKKIARNTQSLEEPMIAARKKLAKDFSPSRYKKNIDEMLELLKY